VTTDKQRIAALEAEVASLAGWVARLRIDMDDLRAAMASKLDDIESAVDYDAEEVRQRLDLVQADIDGVARATDTEVPPEALEASLGLDPWCPGCSSRRVPGGSLCHRCVADEVRS